MILHHTYHDPVLLPQVIEGLNIKSGGKYIDATLGGGGYAFEITRLGGVVLGIDLDTDALDYVTSQCQKSKIKGQIGGNLIIRQGNFRDLIEIASEKGFEKIDGIIFDLGMSTNQLVKSGRGFTFKGDEDLDMRMDKTGETKAKDIINHYSYSQLYEIFTKYAEELHSRVIVEAIVRSRSLKKIETTGDLEKVIRDVITKVKINSNQENKNRECERVIARIFQALRIVVNDEIGNLTAGIKSAVSLLNKNGRICVLSYHSLEDREVKKMFRDFAGQNIFKIITKSPVRADYQAVQINSKSRPAKLRIGEKTA